MKLSRTILLFAPIFLFLACNQRATKATISTSETPFALTIELSDSILHTGKGDTISLGRMKQGEVVVQTIEIKNMEAVPIIILGIETTCGCTTVKYPKRPLKPSEITFTFDSKGERGSQIKAFYLVTSINSLRHPIYITAEVE